MVKKHDFKSSPAYPSFLIKANQTQSSSLIVEVNKRFNRLSGHRFVYHVDERVWQRQRFGMDHILTHTHSAQLRGIGPCDWTHFFSCAHYLHQKSPNVRKFVDDPYMLLGNMYKTFTKRLAFSHDEESLIRQELVVCNKGVCYSVNYIWAKIAQGQRIFPFLWDICWNMTAKINEPGIQFWSHNDASHSQLDNICYSAGPIQHLLFHPTPKFISISMHGSAWHCKPSCS